MIVQKEKFYHIHKIVPGYTLTIGQELIFNKSKHNFFIEKIKKECTEFLSPEYRKDLFHSRELAEKGTQLIGLIDKIPDLCEQNKILVESFSNFLNIHSQINNYLGYYIKYLREMIFEEIRIKHYSDKPSRMHGIWLCSESEISTWKKIIGGSDEVEVYQVAASGNIHHANASLIFADTLQIFEYEELASLYWTEKPFEKDYCRESEILFEGHIEIINKINYD